MSDQQGARKREASKRQGPRALRARMLASSQWILPGRSASAGAGNDPSARMFGRIRVRMTLWYSVILALILLLAGGLLYVGMRRVLLAPVMGQLQHEAGEQSDSWQLRGDMAGGCVPQARLPAPYLEACLAPDGKLISINQPPDLLNAFTSTSLANAALSNTSTGTASDTATEALNPDTGQGGPGQPGPDTVAQGSATVLRFAQVVHDGNGQVLGVVEVGLDISGEAHALNTLLTLLLIVGGITLLACGIGGALLAGRALAPARLAFTRQQAFIADASHELRTPLTLLRANAEVLLRGRERLDPEDAPLLDDIVAEVAHMGALAENLLTLARLDAGTAHPEREVVNLTDMAKDVTRQARALAAERQIELSVAPGPDALVIGDSTRLSEVALILVDNAIKYNRPGGSVRLRTAHEGAQVILEVTDTGIGIAPEHLEHLGERFYRVDKARSRQMGGAGLGIAIARRIAAAHHGSLTLTSVPGQGTTATLRLPAAS